jgi:YggT family protein
MTQVLIFVAWLIDLYIWVVIIQAIMSWLIAFKVINTSNQFVHAVGNALYRLTEPFLRRIRRIVPVMGGIDFSPLVAIIALLFFKNVVVLGWLLGPVRTF